MEFDIVELGNIDGRRWLSIEFDIVDTDLLKEFVPVELCCRWQSSRQGTL